MLVLDRQVVKERGKKEVYLDDNSSRTTHDTDKYGVRSTPYLFPISRSRHTQINVLNEYIYGVHTMLQPLNGQGSRLGHKIFVDGHILSTFLAVARLFHSSERGFCSGRIAYK